MDHDCRKRQSSLSNYRYIFADSSNMYDLYVSLFLASPTLIHYIKITGEKKNLMPGCGVFHDFVFLECWDWS